MLTSTQRRKINAQAKARWAKAKKTAATKASKSKASKPASPKAPPLKLTNPGEEPAAAHGRASVPVAYQTEDTTLTLAQLTPGPWQDRTELPEAYLADLAVSIEEHGILSRLWVRPKDKPGRKGETHEIIAGECRWRAAQRTRHLIAPVTIYHVTADQAKVLSIIENLQRENLNEIDEAQGFKKLIEAGWQAWNPAEPERSVGHKVGKSKTYIYAALKLCELPKLGLEAVRAGQLSASVGVRIARIPNEKARKEALQQAIDRQWTDDRAADEIARRYMTELKGAPFDRKDETLSPERGSCDKCPLRSGNQAEMFADMAKGRADICTDPPCFRGKCRASFDRRARAHEEAGGRVLSTREAKEAGLNETYSSIGGKWAKLDDAAYWLPGALAGKNLRAVLKEEIAADPSLVALALANDDSGKHYQLVERERALKALKAAGQLKKEDKTSGGRTQGDYEREAKERKERENGIIRWQLGKVAATAQTASYNSAHIWRAIIEWLIDERGRDICRHICESRGLDVKAFKLESDQAGKHLPRCLHAHAAELAPEALVPLLLELLCAPGWTREGELPERAHPILALLKLDPDALFEEALAAIPGGAAILKEREFIKQLTGPIIEILGSVPEGEMAEDELWESLEKTEVVKTMAPEPWEAIESLDDWWTAAGKRDGRIEKRGWDRYRLRAAATKPEEEARI